jgi:hypothetical protein
MSKGRKKYDRYDSPGLGFRNSVFAAFYCGTLNRSISNLNQLPSFLPHSPRAGGADLSDPPLALQTTILLKSDHSRWAHWPCHPERSEGSRSQILRCAQNDTAERSRRKVYQGCMVRFSCSPDEIREPCLPLPGLRGACPEPRSKGFIQTTSLHHYHVTGYEFGAGASGWPLLHSYNTRYPCTGEAPKGSQTK